MKTIEELEKEYEEYSIKSDFITNLEEFRTFLDFGIEETEITLQEIEQERKENNRQKLTAKIRNYFPFLFAEEEIDFYDKDNAILEENIILAYEYKCFFQNMNSIATEDNFKELTKLVDFSTEYYNKHMDYLDSKREQLEYSLKGISFINNKYEDNREVFSNFYIQKLEEIITKKQVEKKKSL